MATFIQTERPALFPSKTSELKVYVWLPQDGQVGHASLELTNGTHISWWPDAEKRKKIPFKTKKGANPNSLDEDIFWENRNPDRITYISGNYDEDAMERWWEEFKYSGSYTLLGKNCCWVVYTALRKGGAPRKRNFLWKPTKIVKYVSTL